MVVDVKTTKADVIACYISLLLADVIANIFVVDVMTTHNTEADVIVCYIYYVSMLNSITSTIKII